MADAIASIVEKVASILGWRWRPPPSGRERLAAYHTERVSAHVAYTREYVRKAEFQLFL